LTSNDTSRELGGVDVNIKGTVFKEFLLILGQSSISSDGASSGEGDEGVGVLSSRSRTVDVRRSRVGNVVLNSPIENLLVGIVPEHGNASVVRDRDCLIPIRGVEHWWWDLLSRSKFRRKLD
jgi:hypothetical protein